VLTACQAAPEGAALDYRKNAETRNQFAMWQYHLCATVRQGFGLFSLLMSHQKLLLK
jgi:hypothetical protein